MMKSSAQSVLKVALVWLACFGVRFLPYRPPNVEPILTSTMPVAKRYGLIVGFLFGFLSIFLYDFALGYVGSWTVISASMYGLLGIFSYWYLQNKANSPWNYLLFAIIGTLVYDLVTGVLLGPVLFGGSLRDAFVGQIPFTINHLAGNIILSLALSPILYYWFPRERIPEISSL